MICRRWYGIVFIALCLFCGVVTGGCPGFPGAPAPRSRLSLADIGERSLALGECLEEEGLSEGALEAYRRALWAMEYEERLTGAAPLLLEEARDGVRRLSEGER